jgi:uncharacterized delta-60 repeat protein
MRFRKASTPAGKTGPGVVRPDTQAAPVCKTRRLSRYSLAAALALFQPALTHAQDHILDPGFGSGGQRVVPFDLGSGNSDRAVKVLRRTDGRYVVVGTASSPTGPRVAITRLTADGALDTSFNGTGRANYEACMEEVTDAALDAENRILVLGNTTTCGTSGSPDGRLMRLTAGGQLDVNFSGGGLRNVQFTTVTDAHERAFALVVRANGEVLVGGGVDLDGTGSAFVEQQSVTRFNPDGAFIQTLPGVSGAVSARVIAGARLLDGGVVWAVSVVSPLSAGSGRIWRMNSTLANDTSFSTFGNKWIQSGGPETGCGTGVQHVPTTIVPMLSTNAAPVTFKVFGFANVNGTLRSWYASVNDAVGGTGLRIRCLTDTIPGDVSALAAAYHSTPGLDDITLAGVCGFFQQCVFRVRLQDPATRDLLELDPGFNGGLPLVLSYQAQAGNEPAGGGRSILRQPDGATVVAGWRRWNTSGDDDFAISRLGVASLLSDGFESSP